MKHTIRNYAKIGHAAYFLNPSYSTLQMKNAFQML